MELRYLKTFRKVAVFGSFSRAADHLFLAQSTVSTHVKSLEEELGVPLFDRLGRQIGLTGAGELLFRQCKRLLAIEEETLAEITSYTEPKGSLTIRTPQTVSTYYLPPVLSAFSKKYPKVRLEMTGCTFSVERELRSGTIDLAFLLTHEFSSPNLHYEVIGKERLFLVTNPLHPLADRKRIVLSDLTDTTLMLAKTDCAYRRPFEQQLAEKKVSPASVMEFNSIEAIKQSAVAGAGIALLPERAVRAEVDSKKLSVLNVELAPDETSIWMIWHKDKWISPILKAFIETVAQ